MIQFIDVSKIYPNKYTALDRISFEIAEGEFVFLIGPSGSGKTTIIKHLIREETPTEGRIYFDEDEITKYKRKHVYELRRKIGVIFQDYKLINDKNSYENIAFAMEAAGKSHKDIEETVPYVLDIVGLAHRADAFPEQLSGGEKQRIAIARAISNNPKLLIADEPTGNLDPDAAWDIVQILSKINNWGTTVIMSTHGSEIVDALGKRVIALEGGRITHDILKGTYRNDDLQIEKEKAKQKKAKEKKQEKPLVKEDPKKEDREDKKEKKSKEEKKEKAEEKTEKVEKVEKVETIEKKDKKKNIKKPKFVIPPITLTDRRKAKDIENTSFEEKVTNSLEPEKKAKTKEITNKTDIKGLGLNPKLTSILKAFGYEDLQSMKNAGFKKISKIDELSTKDLQQIKKLINLKTK